MRLHSCRHCGETFCTHAELRRHLRSHTTPTSDHTYSWTLQTSRTARPFADHTYVQSSDITATGRHACPCCGKYFSRRCNMLRHARSTCKKTSIDGDGDYGVNVCDVCGRSFGIRLDLIQYKRTVRCDLNGPPSPKRSTYVASEEAFVEDPVEAPLDGAVGNDVLSDELQQLFRLHWASVRTYMARGPVQSRYNNRLTTLVTCDLEEQLRRVFDKHTHSFKINMSYGFILRNKQTGRYRYFPSSCNCCGRYLDEPSLVRKSQDFEAFLQRVRLPDVLQWFVAHRPDSAWVVEIVTNATFFLKKL